MRDLARRKGKRDVGSPRNDFERLQNEINRLFDISPFEESMGLFDGTLTPAVDVVENKDNLVVTADLPGINKDDIDISITNSVLTIKGEKQDEEETDDKKVYRRESWSGSFQRTVTLPNTVDPDKVKAEMKNGVLNITLPKKEEAKPKKIDVDVN